MNAHPLILGLAGLAILIIIQILRGKWFVIVPDDENGPERDAGVEPRLIEHVCPHCDQVRINGQWEYSDIGALRLHQQGIAYEMCPLCLQFATDRLSIRERQKARVQ